MKQETKKKVFAIVVIALVAYLGWVYYQTEEVLDYIAPEQVEEVTDEELDAHYIQKEAIEIRDSNEIIVQEAYSDIALLETEMAESEEMLLQIQAILADNRALIAQYNQAIEDAKTNIRDAQEIIMSGFEN